jgi:hypothetical protein
MAVGGAAALDQSRTPLRAGSVRSSKDVFTWDPWLTSSARRSTLGAPAALSIGSLTAMGCEWAVLDRSWLVAELPRPDRIGHDSRSGASCTASPTPPKRPRRSPSATAMLRRSTSISIRDVFMSATWPPPPRMPSMLDRAGVPAAAVHHAQPAHQPSRRRRRPAHSHPARHHLTAYADRDAAADPLPR